VGWLLSNNAIMMIKPALAWSKALFTNWKRIVELYVIPARLLYCSPETRQSRLSLLSASIVRCTKPQVAGLLKGLTLILGDRLKAMKSLLCSHDTD
jgi:hypothetical protein